MVSQITTIRCGVGYPVAAGEKIQLDRDYPGFFFPRLPMSALGHVWTAPIWQVIF
jgi:hypothetical protein